MVIGAMIYGMLWNSHHLIIHYYGEGTHFIKWWIYLVKLESICHNIAYFFLLFLVLHNLTSATPLPHACNHKQTSNPQWCVPVLAVCQLIQLKLCLPLFNLLFKAEFTQSTVITIFRPYADRFREMPLPRCWIVALKPPDVLLQS